MKIEKVTTMGPEFTYQITLSNIKFHLEGWYHEDYDVYEVTVYLGETEQELASIETKDNVKNTNDLKKLFIGSHNIVKGIWKNL